MKKFEDRPYSRYQVSKKYPNGIIFVVQGDTLEEMREGIQESKEYLKKEGLLVKEENPVVANQDRDYPQHAPSDDPSWCPIHQVTMKQYEKEQFDKAGEPYTSRWYSHKVGDEWCKGK